MDDDLAPPQEPHLDHIFNAIGNAAIGAPDPDPNPSGNGISENDNNNGESSTGRSKSNSISGEPEEHYLDLLTAPEILALGRFKKHAVTEGLSDRKLMQFLFSRKMSVDRAVELLQANLDFRKKYGLPVDIKAKDVDEALLRCGSMFTIEGTRDRQGRGISYLRPAAVAPSQFSLTDYVAYLLYNIDESQWERPDFHRHGFVVVEDLRGIGFKNIDLRIKGKDLLDVFPGRIQAIYLLHPPFILKPLLRIAKFFVKAKILSRVQIINNYEDLSEYIAPDQLLTDFGGTVHYDHNSHVDEKLGLNKPLPE